MFRDVGICKSTTIVLGLIILVLGLYSHYNSDWVKAVTVKIYIPLPESPKLQSISFERFYHICRQPIEQDCPDIAMEHYFITMIILSFIRFLEWSYFTTLSKNESCGHNLGYHIIGALLLLAAGTVYIVSAEQINELKIIDFDEDTGTVALAWRGLKRFEKLAAGGLTLLQAVLFGATAFLINKHESEMERLD